MHPLKLDRLTRILLLGAHSDDVEIGCGGALLTLLDAHPNVEVVWMTFSGGDGERRGETERSAPDYLAAAKSHDVRVFDFQDGYFPWHGERIKDEIRACAQDFRPDIVFTHTRDDRHQDHRLLSDLAWNHFRDQTILEYEIPKWDGDLGRPNAYVPLSAEVAGQKVALLMEHFASQRGRDWFTDDLFLGLMRLRGVECRAPGGYAEAFHARKFTLL